MQEGGQRGGVETNKIGENSLKEQKKDQEIKIGDPLGKGIVGIPTFAPCMIEPKGPTSDQRGTNKAELDPTTVDLESNTFQPRLGPSHMCWNQIG